MCGIKCRLMFGAKRLHNFFKKGEGHRWESSCAEFNLSTTQDGPPTDYRIDTMVSLNALQVVDLLITVEHT